MVAVVQKIDEELNIQLEDKHFADGQEEAIHVFLHEACHAAVLNCAPWIHDLPEQEHTAVDEIMARMLEDEIAQELGMKRHSAAEHVRELSCYHLLINLQQYNHLRKKWLQIYWPNRDVAGMVHYVKKYLREEGFSGNKS